LSAAHVALGGFFGIYEIVNMVLAVEFRRRLKRCAFYFRFLMALSLHRGKSSVVETK
jgi:hypothetical protein